VQLMSRLFAKITVAGIIILCFRFLIDFTALFFAHAYYEGYVFAIYIILFDLAMIIPLLGILISKNSALKSWALFSILPLNIVLFVGFKLGAAIGLICCVYSLYSFFIHKEELLA
jgi:hypothetical protein